MAYPAYQLPAPADWQAFERFIHELFGSEWKDPRAQLNGRSGQPQAGVDVFGTNASTGGLEGVQCKGKDGRYGHSVGVDELRVEVKRALTFVPSLTHYYLVTSGVADVNVQKEARVIDEAHRKNGRFGVSVYSWDQLLSILQRHPRVARSHFRPLHMALSEINAPAELIAVCHQSFQHAGLFDRVDPAAAAEGFFEVHMDASAFYDKGVLDARSALALQRVVHKDISAQLRAHPKATVAYFGIAHIPLIMHAGSAVSTRQPVDLYELESGSGKWDRLQDGDGPDLGVQLIDMGGPSGAEHAVIQVEISFNVNKTDIDKTITKPYRHFSVRIKEPRRGAITHMGQALEVAKKFRQAIDQVHSESPATTHHVFAATPVSVSFRLGQMVSQTIHRSVLAYNYSQQSDPPYHWAVDLVAQDGADNQLWMSEGAARV